MSAGGERHSGDCVHGWLKDGSCKDCRIDDLEARLAAAERAGEDVIDPMPGSPPCRGCGRRFGLDAMLSNADWQSLGLEGYWCPWCMDAKAMEKGMKFVKARFHMRGSALVSDETESTDLSLARDEITELCAQLHAANQRAEAQCAAMGGQELEP